MLKKKFLTLALGDDATALTESDWRNFLEGRGFRAGVDFPVSLFYKWVNFIDVGSIRSLMEQQNVKNC